MADSKPLQQRFDNRFEFVLHTLHWIDGGVLVFALPIPRTQFFGIHCTLDENPASDRSYRSTLSLDERCGTGRLSLRPCIHIHGSKSTFRRLDAEELL